MFDTDEYCIQILNGTLVVNGEVYADFLDTQDKTYTVTTKLRVEAELQRLARLIFSAGAESAKPSRANGFVPLVAAVD